MRTIDFKLLKNYIDKKFKARLFKVFLNLLPRIHVKQNKHLLNKEKVLKGGFVSLIAYP